MSDPFFRPYPKEQQLGRARKRYRRIVASRKKWEKIWDQKRGPCRCCGTSGFQGNPVDPHHVVLRGDNGDDIVDNIVPICRICHDHLHRRVPGYANVLLERLTDAEYAYMIERGGESYPERAYGVRYER